MQLPSSGVGADLWALTSILPVPFLCAYRAALNKTRQLGWFYPRTILACSLMEKKSRNTEKYCGEYEWWRPFLMQTN